MRWIAGPLVILLAATLPAAQTAVTSDVDRANVLVREVTTLLGTPRSSARDARIEKTVATLDALPDACCLDQKVTAHSAVHRAYRRAGPAARLGTHALWLIDAAGKLAPELRARHGSDLYSLHIEAAEAWSSRGQNDKVRDIVARVRALFPDPAARPGGTQDINRFGLLDRPAPLITASHWLNLPAGQRELPLSGAVTLLEFSAHWCAPCEMSYPALRRLSAKYGSRGFRVVISTGLYGYYGKDKNLTPEAEIERDRAHFANVGITGPIAISGTPNLNSQRYFVGGIPQIHVIDRSGTIRLLIIGWGGSSSEASLDRVIAGLLTGTAR